MFDKVVMNILQAKLKQFEDNEKEIIRRLEVINQKIDQMDELNR